MAAIYIHIPFCRQACSYCDFHFSTSLREKDRMKMAILMELEKQKAFFHSPENIETIYFGGGTPSIYTPLEITEIVNQIHQLFPTNAQEITLEANPEDFMQFRPEWLELESPINRLSIGIQSFVNEHLLLMNRNHSAEDAYKCVELARQKYKNISIDLIFGIPNLSNAQWRKNLQKAIDLGVQHISIYALTVEKKTALAHQVKQKTILIPQEEIYEEQFLIADEVLTKAGFEHYELSNYAKPNFHSQHNSSYWKMIPYLGIGPSAHSFDGKNRFWNISNNIKYIKQIFLNQNGIENQENLSQIDLYNEYLMTHLRKAEGIDLEYIRNIIGIEMEKENLLLLKKYIQNGYMQKESNRYFLTLKGWLISDSIISDLFLV
jgi:oxygen-independent coproporphyrinogen-3 oxidase